MSTDRRSVSVKDLAAAVADADAHEWDLGGPEKWAAAIFAALPDTPEPSLDADRLARAILVAAKEDGRRPTNDGFEWYGSADEMAAGIIAALSTEPQPSEDAGQE